MIRPVKKNEKETDLTKIIDLFYPVFYESDNLLFIKHEKQMVFKLLKDIISQENHFFSYQNIFVYEDKNTIKGIIMVYLHDNLKNLKLNALKLIKNYIPTASVDYLELDAMLSKTYELYIDIIAVCPSSFGQGIGTKLIEFVVEKYLNDTKITAISLNVAHNNKRAKKLYHKLKFIDDDVIMINNHYYDHMIRKIK